MRSDETYAYAKGRSSSHVVFFAFGRSRFEDLCAAMKGGFSVTLQTNNECHRSVFINGIRCEDGSGKSWLITLHNGTEVYFRTV